MKRTNLCMFFTMVIVFVMFESDLAIGQTPVFGPEAYIRETGKPQKVTKDFSIQNPNEEFTLVVQNGEGKRGRLSSAIIELNGVQVVGPNEFNKQIDLIKKPITLQSQNELVVEVRSQPGTSLNVMILGPETPVPSPVSGITVNPDGFPINTPTQVTFTADIPYQPGGSVPTVVLEQVSQTGSVIAVEGTMVDDGQLSLGDEIEGDGIFSFRKTYDITQPSDIWLRVRVDINGQSFYSGIFSVLAFNPLLDTEFQAIIDAQKNAAELYWQTMENKSEQKAIKDTIAYLKGLPIVKDAGISEMSSSIWVDYVVGIGGSISIDPTGGLGGKILNYYTQKSLPSSSNSTMTIAASSNNQVQSTKVLLLSPSFHEFKDRDEGKALKALYENHNNVSGCPTYTVDYLQDDKAGVEAFKKIGQYGIVHVFSHGEIINDNVAIATGTAADLNNVAYYMVDLIKGRLKIKDFAVLAVTPKFFEQYIKLMPSSLVFFASCYSAYKGSIWGVLKNKGAKTYLGFSNWVPEGFAFEKAKNFHQEWIEDPQNLVTTGEVFNDINNKYDRCTNGEKGEVCWNLDGSTNLEAPTGDQLQDGGFESGTLGAWISQGDGRVIKRLGTFSPTEGNRMGIISTGLGYTTDSGAISQKVCIQPDVKKLKFDWNFNSEEFREYCGSIFQDFFRVDLINASGSTTNLFYRKVDDLCADTFAVPFSFDQGDVWSTGWNSESIDISRFVSSNAGKAVTIKFSAGDVGDSIFDTGVLLDRIQISQ